MRDRWERGAMAMAGQRDPAHWSWLRAIVSFAGFCALITAMTVLIDGEPGGIVGGAIAAAFAIATAHRVHLRHRAELEGTPGPPSFTRLQVAVAVVSAIVFVGFVAVSAVQQSGDRDRDQVVARALGAEEVSGADERRIEVFFQTLETFSAQHQAAVVAIGDTGAPVRRHREAVDRLSGTVRELRTIVAGIADPNVKETLTDYMRKVQNLDLAFDNWVEIEEYGDADERAFDVALAEVETASLSMERADEELRDRLAAEMEPEERKKFEEDIRRREREFEEAVGG